MPEYLAPGVYVEETSFRAKSIEGVSTTTTGFVGSARYGPIDLEADIITGLVEFERVYGDRQPLALVPEADPLNKLRQPNFLWHAVRAFFEEGGKRLYVSRVFRQLGAEPKPYKRPDDKLNDDKPTVVQGMNSDGHGRAWLTVDPAAGARDDSILIRARFPGAYGNLRVIITAVLGQNMLAGDKGTLSAGALRDWDTVWIGDLVGPFSPPFASPVGSPPSASGLYLARFNRDEQTFVFNADGGTPTNSDLRLNSTNPNLPALDPKDGHEMRLVTFTVTVRSATDPTASQVWSNLALDPHHRDAFGAPDSITEYFKQNPNSLTQARTLPIVILGGSNVKNGLNLLDAVLDYGTRNGNTGLRQSLSNFAARDAKTVAKSTDTARSIELQLTGGNDGAPPSAGDYEGTVDEQTNDKSGLMAFEDLEDISIVAAPGATYNFANNQTAASATINALISHAERMRYRIAVLDSGDNQAVAEVRAMRAKMDSKYAALYYPWVRVLDPVTNTEINLPPSGFVAGIYARNDVNRAVYKAPANEVVNLAIGFEKLLNKAQQEVLNPEGINCFRFFEGRGFRLWGARTISSDPEWKYVNLRRYFAYLERSIDKGTQWAVFEPNGEQLWGNVRRTLEDFLLNEWTMGALLGDKPEKAYFVRCDRSTMTQNDLDNGRLVCLIGVAPLRPAEFVIFRIGQWTADRKV
jgi:phage tail sheath protein FI